MEYIYDGKHRFELVDHFPLGYEIWNIGKNMLDGYLPLCRVIPGTYNVEVDTLKAIKLDDAQIILAAVGGGEDTIEKMERYLERHKNVEPGTYPHRQVERIKLALPIMKQIKWN